MYAGTCGPAPVPCGQPVCTHVDVHVRTYIQQVYSSYTGTVRPLRTLGERPPAAGNPKPEIAEPPHRRTPPTDKCHSSLGWSRAYPLHTACVCTAARGDRSTASPHVCPPRPSPPPGMFVTMTTAAVMRMTVMMMRRAARVGEQLMLTYCRGRYTVAGRVMGDSVAERGNGGEPGADGYVRLALLSYASRAVLVTRTR